MTMYNMLFGKNADTKSILATIGLKEGYIERFRDCWIDGNEICILTRTGGWTREDFPNVILTSNSYYMYDEDDDFDRTYAIYHFRIPGAEE